MIGFGVVQLLLSQTPNFHKLTWISTVAAATSFGYAFIGSGLSLAVVVQGTIALTYINSEFILYIFSKNAASLLDVCTPVNKSVVYNDSLYDATNILSIE